MVLGIGVPLGLVIAGVGVSPTGAAEPTIVTTTDATTTPPKPFPPIPPLACLTVLCPTGTECIVKANGVPACVPTGGPW
ncbi:MAG: hypothetical protein K0V04_10435 [Deltaproteobacteria bacterium]|nr:hypothetical protein [Deltaproteobacteria bacterium]